MDNYSLLFQYSQVSDHSWRCTNVSRKGAHFHKSPSNALDPYANILMPPPCSGALVPVAKVRSELHNLWSLAHFCSLMGMSLCIKLLGTMGGILWKTTGLFFSSCTVQYNCLRMTTQTYFQIQIITKEEWNMATIIWFTNILAFFSLWNSRWHNCEFPAPSRY